MCAPGSADNTWLFLRPDNRGVAMNDFNRKVEEAAERMEKETVEFIKYLNDEVVPAVRQHSTKALRVAADKMVRLADYMDRTESSSK
jgi:F0F1-type ATP synthase membrane subunit b/b'